MEILPVDCPKIPLDFHLNLRKRYLKRLAEEEGGSEGFANSLTLLKGIETLHKNYDDNDYLPEQESTFWYFFGVKEADCLAAIHHHTGKTVLFIPEIPEDYKLWMVVKSKEEFKQEYRVDEVLFVGELRQYLLDLKPKVYLFSGEDSDSGLKVEEPSASFIEGLTVNR
jgi:Xaa-Pro dipeptidase